MRRLLIARPRNKNIFKIRWFQKKKVYKPTNYCHPLLKLITESASDYTILQQLENFCGIKLIGFDENGNKIYDIPEDIMRLELHVLQLFSHCMAYSHYKSIDWILKNYPLLRVSDDNNAIYKNCRTHNKTKQIEILISHDSFVPCFHVLNDLIKHREYRYLDECFDRVNIFLTHPDLFKYRFTFKHYIKNDMINQFS